MTAPTQEVTPQWQSYLDVTQDVMPYLQMDSLSTADQAKLRLITDMACDWVQDYLGRPVAPTTFFRRFNGWSGLNGSYVTLPYYPIIQVESVVEYWGLSGAHNLTEQTPANQGGQDVYQVDYLRGIVIRTFLGLVQRPWFPGSRNIEITWQAGYDPLPPKLKVATLEMTGYWWRNTQEAPRWFGQAQEGYDLPERTALWAAIPDRVTALLQPYQQQGLG